MGCLKGNLVLDQGRRQKGTDAISATCKFGKSVRLIDASGAAFVRLSRMNLNFAVWRSTA